MNFNINLLIFQLFLKLKYFLLFYLLNKIYLNKLILIKWLKVEMIV